MIFAWNFIDLFVILICIAFKIRFDQINDRIKQSNLHARRRVHWIESNSMIHDDFWSETRTDYNVMVDLVEKIDKETSILVLIGIALNFLKLCVRIFQIFTR